MSLVRFANATGRDVPVEDSATGALPTRLSTLLSGELQQFNRLAGGMVWQYKLVTSAATGVDIAGGPCIFGGIILAAAGTCPGVYDALTATGTSLLPSTTATIEIEDGILLNTGLTVGWTSGTWLVKYVPTA